MQVRPLTHSGARNEARNKAISDKFQQHCPEDVLRLKRYVSFSVQQEESGLAPDSLRQTLRTKDPRNILTACRHSAPG